MGAFIQLTNKGGNPVTVNASKIQSIFPCDNYTGIWLDGCKDIIFVKEPYVDIIHIIGAVDVLTSQPYHATSGWISVSERLPERETMVIVRSTYTYEDGREYVCGSWYDANGEFLIACNVDNVKFRRCHSETVTDWMPMPKYSRQGQLVDERKSTHISHWEWFEEWSPGTPENPRECEDCGWRCSNCKTALADIVGGYWDEYESKPDLKYCPECGENMVNC